MKTVFITGAGGFIGRHLVAELLTANVEIKALMMKNEPIPNDWQGKVSTVVGDIRDLDSISDEIGEFDTCFHLAAIVSDWGAKEEHVDITVKGTEQAIALSVQLNAKFVVTTSIAAFGSKLGSGHLHEDSACGTPASSYEYVKQMQEAVTLDAVKNKGLNATIIRPTNVYGVGSIWVTRYIELLTKRKPALMGDGNWDAGLVHVNNVVQGLILAAKNTQIASGEIFVISDQQGVTWRQYLDALADTLALPKAKSIPNWIARFLAPVLQIIGEVLKFKTAPVVTNLAYRLTGVESVFINQKAKTMLGYQPKTTLQEAMTEIRQCYQQS